MLSSEQTALCQRCNEVLEHIAEAAVKAGRNAQEVRLVAVSKFHPADNIATLATHTTQRLFGENYVQEVLEKQQTLAHYADIHWHFIGHLQSRKAKEVAGRFALIHSVDSLKVAQKLQDAMQELHAAKTPDILPVQPILIEVNVAEEAQKTGLPIKEVPALVAAVQNMPQLSLRGFMCMAPFDCPHEAARPYFATLRRLRDAMQEQFGLELPELSMGMSQDYEIAVTEGATIVRVGTDIFGARPANSSKA